MQLQYGDSGPVVPMSAELACDRWHEARAISAYLASRVVNPLADPDAPCREMPTRACPESYGDTGCDGRPCARFESDDPTPWLATSP